MFIFRFFLFFILLFLSFITHIVQITETPLTSRPQFLITTLNQICVYLGPFPCVYVGTEIHGVFLSVL